jgi:RNA polymerase sigma-70 factor (ECF subfamily)
MRSRVYSGVTEDALLVALPTTDEAKTRDQRLGRLFDAHHQRLFRLARRLAGTADEARDLVQDTFVRAAQSPRSVPDTTSGEEAWLVRVLVNLCRDRWRRRAVERRAAATQIREGAGITAARAENALIAHDAIWRALREIPPRRRSVVVLHELESLSVADIAGLLGITRPTVRWHLAAGRRELSRIIKDGSK